MEECEPLPGADDDDGALGGAGGGVPRGRGLHTPTFRLNVSAFCGIGGAINGCSGGVRQAFGDIRPCHGCILCQKRLRLSWTMDECKPLPRGEPHAEVDVPEGGQEPVRAVHQRAVRPDVGPGGWCCCSPRHASRFASSSLEMNDIR